MDEIIGARVAAPARPLPLLAAVISEATASTHGAAAPAFDGGRRNGVWVQRIELEGV